MFNFISPSLMFIKNIYIIINMFWIQYIALCQSIYT